MENEGTIRETEIIGETDTNSQSQKPKTCGLGVMSMVFGILGPFPFVVMWTVSFLSFHDLIMVSPPIVTIFSCGVAWILGLVLGIKSLEQIKNSEEQLVGRGYAIVGIFTSVVWMVLIFGALLLPALYYVNS